MPLQNWPPSNGTYPSWPPIEFGGIWFSCSNWNVLLKEVQNKGFTLESPNQPENSLFFPPTVRCGDNHQVAGAMLVSPDGTRRYPFARCNNPQDKELLVLWPPYTCGWLSGPDNF